jgi:UDP-3-O-[3-hydroxymyristoyl] glucosamine N-acyltransferase
MTTQQREPRGTESGGQFAASHNPEASVQLDEIVEDRHASPKHRIACAFAATIIDRPATIGEPHAFLLGARPVAAHHHPNGGGWVANTAFVTDSVYVGPDAAVFDQAEVIGRVRLEGTTSVSECAMVGDDAVLVNAHVYGNAVVMHRAKITDAYVKDLATVYEDATVSNHASVEGSARVGDRAQIDHYACVGGHANVVGTACVHGLWTEVSGNTIVRDGAEVGGGACVCGDSELSGDASVTQASRYENLTMTTGIIHPVHAEPAPVAV